ncbi:TRAM domain-containing protein, partial [Salinisphaera sp. USBA-960]|nr:TRAM domain-containing protein [Salifodinibacter halophilus]
MARIDQTPFEIAISDFTHDGRGVGRRPDPKAPDSAGKAVFVTGALPGERVMAKQTSR